MQHKFKYQTGEMLIQNTLPSSVEAALRFVSDDRTQDLLCDWIPSDETWQACPKCNQRHCDGCRQIVSSTRQEQESTSISPFLTDSRNCFKFSSTSNMCASSVPNLVYKRRKLQSNSVSLLSAQATISSKESGGCLSSMSSKDEYSTSRIQNEIDSARASTIAGSSHNEDLLSNGNTSIFGSSCSHKSNDAPCTKTKQARDMETVSKLEFVNGCSCGEDHGFDVVPKDKPSLDYVIVNDTISSSKSNIELGLVSTKADIEENGECSSSLNSIEGLSEKEFCISILRSHGLLQRPIKSYSSIDALGVESISSCSKSCKICGVSDNPLKMLICDNCEDAFHVPCWNPRKKVPSGDWYCQPCSSMKCKSSQKSTKAKSVDTKSEAFNCRNELQKSTNNNAFDAKTEAADCRNEESQIRENSVAFMLEDTEPYTTDVRIGRAFQAEVGDWSGPMSEDYDCFGEPLLMDCTENSTLNGENVNNRFFTPNSVGNWLQCRDVLDDSAGDRAGTICGKWRRAPLFEVQTDGWDCSCAVIWDPVHADCAVPQELETDEVLTHVKYVELLRPRLLGKKRKATPSGSETEDVRSETPNNGGDS